MNALFGAAVLGLLPVPTLPAYYTDMRSYGHRSITTDDVNDAALVYHRIAETMATGDELTSIRAEFLTHLRVPR